MVEPWIIITVAAAFFQNLRSALQKHLRGRLSTVGAGYSRFLYAFPIAAGYLWCLHTFGDLAVPGVNGRFLWFCLLGGICQIMFTVFLLWMFSFQSFAVGTTFSKLEVIMVALLGAILLGDTLSVWAVLAIAISAFGVIALSLGQNKIGLRTLVAGLFRCTDPDRPCLRRLARRLGGVLPRCFAFTGQREFHDVRGMDVVHQPGHPDRRYGDIPGTP